MGHKDEDRLLALHLSFIGKTLSVFTHEVKNHLAILKESVGLIGDLAGMGKISSKEEISESLKIIQSIENQIGKTSWFCTHLNRFGHRMDRPLSTFDVNEAIEELTELLSRLANQKRISLRKSFDTDMPSIYSNPAQLQLLVFCLIEKNLQRIDQGGTIILKTTHAGNSITINIIPEGNFIEFKEEEVICNGDICEHIIRRLGGDISSAAGDGKVSISLPLSFLESSGDVRQT